ncbi:MAG: PAS domain-containing protein [Phycisphaerales bacterium]|nr:PAS domain-containing protein [Phycisphaerales bacterium]
MDPNTDNISDMISLFGAAAGVGIAVVSIDQLVLYHNREVARLYKNDETLDLRGRTLADLFPPAWVEQRARILREIAAGGPPVVIRSIMHGRQIEATLRGIEEEDGVVHRILTIVHAGQTPDDALPGGVRVVESDTIDLGKLHVLTSRELEVLALIGCGHSAKEIGSILGCSHRTVERHRDAIGKKLDVQDRVALASIARAAGLELVDAQRRRIDVGKTPPTQTRLAEPKPQAPVRPTRPAD